MELWYMLLVFLQWTVKIPTICWRSPQLPTNLSMPPPFTRCRGWDLPDPYLAFQESSSTTPPCHHGASGSLGWVCPVGKCLHRISSTRKPPGFLPGTFISGPLTSLPARTRARRLFQLHFYPGGHSVDTARATPALWAKEQNRLPQQHCRYCSELQSLCSHSRTGRLCTTSVTCPSASFVFEEENLHIKS